MQVITAIQVSQTLTESSFSYMGIKAQLPTSIEVKLMTVTCSKASMKPKADLRARYGLSNFNSEL